MAPPVPAQPARPPAADGGNTRSAREQAALDAALAAFPRLRESTGADGAATFATAAFTRRRNRSVAGIDAVMVRIGVRSLADVVPLWRALRAVEKELAGTEGVLRHVVGIGRLREAYVLAVVGDGAPVETILQGPALVAARNRWSDGAWTMRWHAASEFGHWDGFRIRQVRHPG